MRVGLVHAPRIHGLEQVATVQRIEADLAQVGDVVVDVMTEEDDVALLLAFLHGRSELIDLRSENLLVDDVRGGERSVEAGSEL